MIKPTVGRIVLYTPQGHPPNAQKLAAIIAHVWSDTVVNIAVFDVNGRPAQIPPTSVRLLQPYEEAPAEGRYCEWMPYQIGQAAKSEELQSQLEAAQAGRTEDQEAPSNTSVQAGQQSESVEQGSDSPSQAEPTAIEPGTAEQQGKPVEEDPDPTKSA